MFWACLDHRLEVEVTKRCSLEKELGEVKATLLKESDEHDALRVAVQLVYSEVELAPTQETSSLMVHAIQIMDQAHDITRGALCFDVNWSFVIARSHYENIDLEMMSQGFAPGYSDVELEDIKRGWPLWHMTYLLR